MAIKKSTIEEMKVLLKTINPSEKQIFEKIVRERTSQSISLNNTQYNQELMEAHLELARIYGKEGDIKQAHSHYQDAEHEFFNMCKVKTKQPKYMTKDFDFHALMKRNKETENELNHYKEKLFKIADKIGYDSMSLMFISTSDNPKRNLDDLIKKGTFESVYLSK